MSENIEINEETIQRCPHDQENPFTMIRNELIRDASISPNCRWLIIYLLSNHGTWTINVKQIINHLKGKLGRDSIYDIINEAIEAGYMNRITEMNGNLKGKTKYFISEYPKFKKILRHTESRDTDPRDPEKTHIKKEPLEIIKKQQQQQDAAVFSHLLNDFEATIEEKNRIIAKYSAEEIFQALQDIKRVEIKTTPIQTLQWILKDKPNIPPKKEDQIEQNRELAKTIEGRFNDNMRIDVTLFEVQFIFTTCQRQPEIVRYDEVNFKERVRNYLQKYEFI